MLKRRRSRARIRALQDRLQKIDYVFLLTLLGGLAALLWFLFLR